MLYRETFSAAQTKRFAIPGNFFRLKRLTGVTSESIDVVFYRDNARVDADLSDADAGDGIGPLPVGQGFDYFEITSAEAQDVYFDVARGPRFSQRVVGEVSVIDGGLALTKADKAFISSPAQAAVAAQFSHCQLWNPAGSGKRLIVSSVGFFCATMNVQLRYHNAALANLFGTNNPVSKLIGGAVSVSQSRIEANVAVLGSFMATYTALTGTFVKDVFEKPIVVPPGFGIHLNGVTVNIALTANFQHTEETI